jgi:hypothetical protein
MPDKTITMFELRKRHFPEREDFVHGPCIVIPEKEFPSEWAVSLERYGQRCIKQGTNILVKLAVGEAKEISFEKAPGKITGSATDKKTPLKTLWASPEVEKGMVKGVDVQHAREAIPEPKHTEPDETLRAPNTQEEDNYLIELYQKVPLIHTTEIAELFHKKYPKRCRTYGLNRLQQLITEKNLPRRGRNKKYTYAPSSEIADAFIIDLYNQGKVYEEIRAAVKEKYPDKSICIDYRMQLLRANGSIKRRNKLGGVEEKDSSTLSLSTVKLEGMVDALAKTIPLLRSELTLALTRIVLLEQCVKEQDALLVRLNRRTSVNTQ